MADVGSGALLPVGDEPRVQDAVGQGADLTIFSGDKLLGGPQAGIAVGRARWISAMRRHPLARALRADKLCLAALEATLNSYLDGTAEEDLPTLRMIRDPGLRDRTEGRQARRGIEEQTSRNWRSTWRLPWPAAAGGRCRRTRSHPSP